MKKLLTLFSVFVLGSGSILWVASCKTRVKHIIDDEEVDANKDLEILNQIRSEVKQTLSMWWDTKATININDYPTQIVWFEETADTLRVKDDSLTFTRQEISAYYILEQLLTGFKAEFDNLNQSLRDRYSNYYVDTMPLLLKEHDILFTLYNVKFDNLAKLFKNISQDLIGITVQSNFSYEIRFKKLISFDSFDSNLIISNDLENIKSVRTSLNDYFANFLNILFKEIDWRIIVHYTNRIKYINSVYNYVKKLIAEELLRRDISFYADFELKDTSPGVFKVSSVLAWAGEGYPRGKLTVENFLKFYKKQFF